MFWLMPLISGLGTWAATGDFKKGLMSGLLGAGIGGIAGALGGAAGGAKGVADAANLASTTGNLTQAGSALGQGIGAVGQGVKAAGDVASMAGQAVNAAGTAGGNGGIMSAGLNFLQNKPVTSGLMLSALTSAAMPPEVETEEKKKGERFADERHTVSRETLPFTGMPQPGPSTYTRDEQFTPDNPYRYGQYEGEKMFFDNPGLSQDGIAPPLPDGPGGGGGGIDSIPPHLLAALIRSGGRGRQAFAGGGMLKGPGDGQSDSIPASGPGMDIVLSDGEYVIPADVVSALGAGSSDAGARRLDSAMSKIRTMSYGSGKQARRPARVSI